MTFAPLNIPIPRACCDGWFFEHTTDCPDPARPRPCSDCGADAHPDTPSESEHSPDCSWWFADTDDVDTDGPSPLVVA